jgi:D-amino-acid dehydrogenase
MEFSGLDYQLERRKADYLLHLARTLMPEAGDYDAVDDSWAGLRPMTPDGRPIIGPSRFENLWLNIGHGMLGNTLAFGSAQLLADHIDGIESPLDPSAFHPGRFSDQGAH